MNLDSLTLQAEWIPSVRGRGTGVSFGLMGAPKPGGEKVLIVLHGRGDSLESFRSVPEELRLPQFSYLLLNAPRKYDDGYSWYAFEPKQQKGIIDSRLRLIKTVNALMDHGYRAEDIYIYGFSQGALLGIDFALNAGLPIGGVVAMSGYIYFFKNWQSRLLPASFQTPMLVTHGREDDALPIERTREQVAKLVELGLPVVWREFDKGHEVDLEDETHTIRLWLNSLSQKSRRPKTDRVRTQALELDVFLKVHGNINQALKKSTGLRR